MNCNFNFKYIVAFKLRNMPDGLYLVLKYFPSLLPHSSLRGTRICNDAIHSVPSKML